MRYMTAAIHYVHCAFSPQTKDTVLVQYCCTRRRWAFLVGRRPLPKQSMKMTASYWILQAGRCKEFTFDSFLMRNAFVHRDRLMSTSIFAYFFFFGIGYVEWSRTYTDGTKKKIPFTVQEVICNSGLWVTCISLFLLLHRSGKFGGKAYQVSFPLWWMKTAHFFGQNCSTVVVVVVVAYDYVGKFPQDTKFPL